MRNSILFGAASILLASTAVAQNGTDDCSAPTAIGEGVFAFDTSTMAALADQACDGRDFDHDMFWAYTTTIAGDLTIEADGFDIQLGLYMGSDCLAACTDSTDSAGSTGTETLTVAGVGIGDTFVIQVGGWSGANGAGTLNVSVNPPVLPPANDVCGTATIITGTGDFAFDATAADDSGYTGDGGCALDSDNEDVFFQWTVPANGDYHIRTQDDTIAYDSRMNVYLGAACDATDVCVASNDDDDDAPGSGAGTWYSAVNLTNLVAGDVYTIQVGTFSTSGTAATTNVLTITQGPDGTSCDLALPISGTGDTVFDNTGVNPSMGGSVGSGFNPGGCHSGTRMFSDMFFLWTPAVDGDYIISTNNSTILTDTNLAVYDGGDCVAPACLGNNDDIDGTNFLSELTLTNLLASNTYLIQVGGWDDTQQGEGTLSITLAVDPCAGLVDDAFEENDDCATAATLGAGTYAGLNVSDTDADFYVVTLPGNHILTWTEDAGADAVYDIYNDAACTTLLGTAAGSFTLTNNLPTSGDFGIEVRGVSTLFTCAEYDVTLAIDPDPCVFNDDAFEDNDDCATATPMTDGTTTGLQVSQADFDYYEICVANGATVNVDVLHIAADGDIDASLFTADGTACGGTASALANGATGTDNENLTWTNTTGLDTTVIIEVREWVNSGNASCNNYDLVISGSGCTTPTGTPFCDPMNPNSTGLSTTMTGYFGSGVGSDLHLDVTNGPDSRFGYMLVGTTFSDPGLTVSEGRLCLSIGIGSVFGRYNVAGTLNSIGAFDSNGDYVNLVGTSTTGFGFDVPSELPFTGSPMIMSGESWSFQYWHRDMGSASNFSNGLTVTF